MGAAAVGEIDAKSFARHWDELTLAQKAEQVRIYSQLPKDVRDVYCKYVYRPIDGNGEAKWYNQSEINALTANTLARFQVCAQSFFYHAVTRERLESLVAAGRIELSEAGGHTAAFVTTSPLRELGDYFLALGRQHVERDYHLECGFKIPGQPVYVAGLFPEITLNESTLLYVISVKESLIGRRTLARKLRLLSGRDIPVIHYHEAIRVINRVARLSMGIPLEWHNHVSQAEAAMRDLTGGDPASSSSDSEFIIPIPLNSSASSSSGSDEGSTTATEGSSSYSYYTTSKSSSDEDGDGGTTSSSGSYETYSSEGSGSDDESDSTSQSSNSSTVSSNYASSGSSSRSSSSNSSYYTTSRSSSDDDSSYDYTDSEGDRILPPAGLSAHPSPAEFERVWADSSLSTKAAIVRYFGEGQTHQVLRVAVSSIVYRDISPLVQPIWLSQSELNLACPGVAEHKRICLEGFYFHTTTLDLLERSIRQGRIDPREEQLYSGVKVSTIPLTTDGDDVIVALRRSVEWSSEVSKGTIRYDQSFNYVGVFRRSIPLNDNTLAYIIVADEAQINPTLLESRLRRQSGIEIAVFTKAVAMPVILEVAQLGLGIPADWPVDLGSSLELVAGLTSQVTVTDESRQSSLSSPDWSLPSTDTERRASSSEEASGSLSYPGYSSQSDYSEEASA